MSDIWLRLEASKPGGSKLLEGERRASAAAKAERKFDKLRERNAKRRLRRMFGLKKPKQSFDHWDERSISLWAEIE